MKTRRGSSLWPETDGLSSMIYRFEPGDIVIPVAVEQSHFLGVVKEVLPKINKVMVLWNGGCLKQHDPDEIMLEAHQNEIVRTRMASSRRSKGKSAEKIVAAAKSFDDLPDSEKTVAKKMAAKGYKYIVQITTDEGKFGEPLYFKSATAVGPLLRTFPDYVNAKTEWVMELPPDIVKASENFEFAGSRRGSAVLPAKKSSEQTAAESPVPHGEQYVGNPETHGINEPRGGGFSIMQDLQKDLHREQKKESEAGPKIAAAGPSAEQLYRSIRNGLLRIIHRVSRIFPDTNLRYGNRELVGTVAGHDVKVFYEILRASNGEVAGLPVIILDGKRYDRFHRNVEDKLREIIGEPVMASKKRRSTGEMGYHDIQPGGDYYDWAKMIEFAAKTLQRKTGNKIRFQSMKPFDVYQGPYASMNYGRLWSGEREGGFFYDGVVEVSGDIDDIAEAVNKAIKSRAASNCSKPKSLQAESEMEEHALFEELAGGPSRAFRMLDMWRRHANPVGYRTFSPREKENLQAERFVEDAKREGYSNDAIRQFCKMNGIAFPKNLKRHGATDYSNLRSRRAMYWGGPSRVAAAILRLDSWKDGKPEISVHNQWFIVKKEDTDLGKLTKVSDLNGWIVTEIKPNRYIMVTSPDGDEHDFAVGFAQHVASLKSRRAMYWGAPKRIYRLTKNEQENGMAICPRCKSEMSKEPFTKSEKLYTCPSCGFKVPSSKMTTTKIEIEVENGEVTDVDVTTARRTKKSSLARDVMAFQIDSDSAVKILKQNGIRVRTVDKMGVGTIIEMIDRGDAWDAFNLLREEGFSPEQYRGSPYHLYLSDI